MLSPSEEHATLKEQTSYKNNPKQRDLENKCGAWVNLFESVSYLGSNALAGRGLVPGSKGPDVHS